MDSAKLKDRDPDVTIQAIRAKLAQVGLHPVEEIWFNPAPGTWSVGLADAVLPVRVNGKGASRPLALASAYGEFMERLQNGFLVPERYGLLSEEHRFHPDTQPAPRKEVEALVRRRYPTLLALPLEGWVGKDWKEVDCAPYYRVRTGTVERLPISLIRAAQGSNGMCAGNTPEEALVQGLSEIAERYVARQIAHHDDLSTPTIPDSAIGDPGLLSLIHVLRRAGLVVLVKDCTLGGRFPVLATIILDEARTRYTVSFGAHPIFEVALERCLTEAYQGAATLADSVHMPFDLGDERLGPLESEDANRCFNAHGLARLREGRLPRKMFLDGGPPAHAGAFVGRSCTNRDLLSSLTGRLLDKGWDLHVRDVGFLGFPSYYLYVPGVSELCTPNRHRLPHSPAVLKAVGTLYRLPEASLAELTALWRVLEQEVALPAGRFESRHGTVLDLFPIRVWTREETPFARQTSTFHGFMSLLSQRVGNPAAALVHYRAFLDGNGDRDATESCRLAILEELAAGRQAADIASELAPVFGRREVAGLLLHGPERILAGSALPVCGDCGRCQLRRACLVEEWRDVARRLAGRAVESSLDQAALGAVFGSVGKGTRRGATPRGR